MFKKACKYTLLTMLLLSGGTSYAGLIDNGGSTTDLDTGLEWLDLSATNGSTVGEAVAAHGGAGYIYANDSLVSGLLAAFNITYQFSAGGVVDLGAAATDIDNFVSLLGNTSVNASLGYFNVDSRNAYACIGFECGPDSFTNDTDFGRHSSIGVFLVRQASGPGPAPVPAPAT